ncbi:DUF2752 domain-containing protein [Nocardia arthritidis]|uniref:DUF2752 domain-containing protein n=2 Tax=Nocardia arthritidis TaxID=228602 RepID=A0A6G9Y5H4_9NOCA|nr:DUF2752 domain-containing protein [Nocardia arthritidis]
MEVTGDIAPVGCLHEYDHRGAVTRIEFHRDHIGRPLVERLVRGCVPVAHLPEFEPAVRGEPESVESGRTGGVHAQKFYSTCGNSGVLDHLPRLDRRTPLAVANPPRLPLMLVESTHLVSEAHGARWRTRGVPLLVAGAGIGALVLLHLRDPHQEGSYGECPVYALTGWYCPGCGGLRAVHNLTDGHLIDAIHSNILALPLVMAFLVWVTDWTVRAWRGQSMRLPSIGIRTAGVFFALLAVYSVLRNTPWGTWLTPV